MDNIDYILRKLDEAGATGLDLSPGDPIARDAAQLIRSMASAHVGVTKPISMGTRKMKKGEKCKCGMKPIATMDIYISETLISSIPFCSECASAIDINIDKNLKVEYTFLRQT